MCFEAIGVSELAPKDLVVIYFPIDGESHGGVIANERLCSSVCMSRMSAALYRADRSKLTYTYDAKTLMDKD